MTKIPEMLCHFASLFSLALILEKKRFEDGSVNLQELFRSLAERLVNENTLAEAEQAVLRYRQLA